MAVNTHMTHLEDLVLIKGLVGAREIFYFLTSLGEMLRGDVATKVSASVKWDGAPAIFMGVDPKDNKFFIAKKGFFNAEPQMYKSHSDIDTMKPGLREKFHTAFTHLSKLGLRSGMVQGDLMFTEEDIKIQTIHGERYYTFHPNTIVYAVPVKSALGKQIKTAKIGIVFHTTYHGVDIHNMHASFGIPIVDRLNKTSSVWMDDATYDDESGQATMTKSETAKFHTLVSNAGNLLRRIPSKALNSISSHPDLLIIVQTYNNSKIRSGQKITNTTMHARGLLKYIHEKYKKEADSRKSEAGKKAVYLREEAVVRPLEDASVNDLARIFEFMNIVVDAKHMLIKKMDQASKVATFLRTQDGFKVTTTEGYVAIDHLATGAVKLVDRLEFSHANFSPEIMKGWQK